MTEQKVEKEPSKEVVEIKCAICGEIGAKDTTCPKCGHFHEWGYDWKATRCVICK